MRSDVGWGFISPETGDFIRVDRASIERDAIERALELLPEIAAEHQLTETSDKISCTCARWDVPRTEAVNGSTDVLYYRHIVDIIRFVMYGGKR